MPEFKDQLQRLQYEKLTQEINSRNDLVGQINAVAGDKESLATHYRESEEFSDLRHQIALLQDELDQKVNVKVEDALSNADNNVEGVKEKVAEIDKIVKAGLTHYKLLYGDESAAELPKVERVKGARKSGGGGGKRVRGYRWVVTDDQGMTEECENASAAAKVLGVDTKDLQEMFFAKAGVEKSSDAPDEVDISAEWVDVDEEGVETNRSATIHVYREKKDEPEADAESPSEDDLATV